MKILWALFVSVLLVSCGSEPKSEEELKADLQTQECTNAVELVSGNLTYEPIYKNILFKKVKGLKLDCKLNSKATVATFKDVKVEVRFLTKTGSLLFSDSLVVYEFLKPGGSVSYQTEIEVNHSKFKDIASHEWTVLSVPCGK